MPGREDVLEIRMQGHDATCGVCGEDCDMRFGIPTYNGDVVSNDFPEQMWADGGGSFVACEGCFRKHERGEMPVWDRLYLPTSPMGVHLVDGGGI